LYHPTVLSLEGDFATSKPPTRIKINFSLDNFCTYAKLETVPETVPESFPPLTFCS